MNLTYHPIFRTIESDLSDSSAASRHFSDNYIWRSVRIPRSVFCFIGELSNEAIKGAYIGSLYYITVWDDPHPS